MSRTPRLAWFSPMPPARTGVATVSAELLPALRASCEIDAFADASNAPLPDGCRSAHDFVWLNLQRPYDLTVFQLGNSSAHEYMWPYLFRHPGLTVLHDAHLHHARAAALLRAGRTTDYRAEFVACHPDVSVDLAEIGIAGFDTHLYYQWPMTRLVTARARLTAVHTPLVASRLLEASPGIPIHTIRLGHGSPVDAADARARRDRIRRDYGLADDAIVFGCYGGLAPEKRIPQIVKAFAALHEQEPRARLLLAGAIPAHYDLAADLAARCAPDAAIIAGYLESDEELTSHICAADVALNLRWPTAREVSGPWLRCLAAGVPTVITQLSHLRDVPWLDPRTWRSNGVRGPREEPGGGDADSDAVCVAVDVLDEDHSLLVAMQRLARDARLRAALAAAGRTYWAARHDPRLMVADYLEAIGRALRLPVPQPALPVHLSSDGHQLLSALLEPFGTADPLR